MTDISMREWLLQAAYADDGLEGSVKRLLDRIQELEANRYQHNSRWFTPAELVHLLVVAEAKVQELEAEIEDLRAKLVAMSYSEAMLEGGREALEREVAAEKERTALMYGRWEVQGKRADELEREVADHAIEIERAKQMSAEAGRIQAENERLLREVAEMKKAGQQFAQFEEDHLGVVRDDIVHLCDWASQPDIRIKCTGAMTTPAWVDTKVSQDVYRADNGDIYTFDRPKVTCPECLK